jgi:hypothetical protein
MCFDPDLPTDDSEQNNIKLSWNCINVNTDDQCRKMNNETL